MNNAGSFLVTSEYQRFSEFCDACRQYQYIGLCYGSPGVGKTLSARRYALWDSFQSLPHPGKASDSELETLKDSDVVLYTPEILNSPKMVQQDVRKLCSNLRNIREEPSRRFRSSEIQVYLRKKEEEQAKIQAQRDEFYRKEGWFAELPPNLQKRDSDHDLPSSTKDKKEKRTPLEPVNLILVDEADRLKVACLEQLRDIFDRSGGIGLIFIGMPGIEKRLARYPQLYSRIGFVHSFQTLRTEEVRRLLTKGWKDLGVSLPPGGINDEEAIAAVIRITGGNFRLLHRLLSQIERILEINRLSSITLSVVEAARESLVIGSAA